MDYLTRGFGQTQAALKKAGVAYAGPPDTVTIVHVRGLRVAVMGFSPYPWSAPLNDIPAAARLVRRAAAEASIVIVLMHAGAEGRARSTRLTAPRLPTARTAATCGRFRTP